MKTALGTLVGSQRNTPTRPCSQRISFPTGAIADAEVRNGGAADLNRGWRLCREGRIVYLVDSPCFLVGPDLSFLPVFGQYCSQVVPKFLNLAPASTCGDSALAHHRCAGSNPWRAAGDTCGCGAGRRSRGVEAARAYQGRDCHSQSCSKRSRLLANQSQHLPTPLEARPPDRVVPGGIAL
jgi:hypothetical protein